MSLLAANFCQTCGGPLHHCVPDLDTRNRPVCPRCGFVFYKGPTILVTVMVVARDQLLLIKRGTRPYINKWAPPGGFVEAGESLETAAIREVQEEAGLELTRDQLLPTGMLSVPEINQVYASFLGLVDRPLPLRPTPPEAIDAGWFSEQDFPTSEVWDPARDFDLGKFLASVRTRQFERCQNAQAEARMISITSSVEHW